MEATKLKRSIAEAAVRCFRQNGFDAVTVEQICREAGIVRSTFYRMFAGKKEIITFLMENSDANRIVRMEDLLMAPNDYERMWLIGDRYITLCEQMGPGVTAALFSMELQGELDLMASVRTVHDWFIRLTGNCQKAGIIRNPAPAELLGPALTAAVYHQIFTWTVRRGDYPLRGSSRRMADMLVDLAPEYRWTEDQYQQADAD